MNIAYLSVESVKQQLDTENLGIITQSAFLNEFYPESEPNYIPDKFTVYHYNGLARSNHDNTVNSLPSTHSLLNLLSTYN